MAGLYPEELRARHELRIALADTAKAGDAAGLLALLASPEGKAAPRTLDYPAAIAASNGDTHCLRILHECGFVLSDRTWVKAADYGHVNCLAFAVSHGCELTDSVLEKAVRNGHLACVEFLLQQGLPRRPYTHDVCITSPDQLKCIQLMLGKQDAVGPQTLIVAARQGDLDFVRWLHERGVPLWDHAQDERFFKSPPPPQNPVDRALLRWCARRNEMIWRQENEARPGTLYFPWDPHASLWKVLSYGARHGAPVSDRAKQILEETRRQTHAVLLSFRAAARLCQAPGRKEQMRVWAGMAVLPSALVEELLIAADLEIPESLMRRPLLREPAVAGPKGPQGRRAG